MSDELIKELHSAAATLRTPTNGFLPNQDRVTAELLERAASAMHDADFRLNGYRDLFWAKLASERCPRVEGVPNAKL